MKQKAIRVDYYEIWKYTKKDGNNYADERTNISYIFEVLKNGSITERTFKYGGETIRFQEIKYDEENKTWEIQILRSRNSIIPGIADNLGGYIIDTLEKRKVLC
ncbi:MAG: hypothetical protein HFJ34_05230 [Clostridia bacterium]|nr:hypothetical protein [Clostridia bacterium]